MLSLMLKMILQNNVTLTTYVIFDSTYTQSSQLMSSGIVMIIFVRLECN